MSCYTALKRRYMKTGYIVALLVVVFIVIKLLPNKKNGAVFGSSDLSRNLHVASGRDRLQKIEHQRRLRITSAVAGYCNHPENITIGAEGLPPDDYHLVSVTVLIRHGNRLPMPDTVPIGPMSIPLVSCKLDTSNSAIPDTLQKFIDAVRSAGNAAVQRPDGVMSWPFSLIPDTTYCQPADLTQIGVEQHLQNGQILRQAYNDLLGGITQIDLNVTSTVRSRTYQSAVAFVYGLLGDSVDYNSLNIQHTTSTVFCRNERADALCTCDQVATLMAQGEANLRQTKDSDYKTFRRTVLGMLSGTKYDVKAYFPWKTAHDLYMSRLCRREPLPCNADGDEGVCFTESQADLNWRSLSIYHTAMSNEGHLRKASQLSIYYYLREMINRLLRQATVRPDNIRSMEDRFTIYSGHDNTLSPLLLALGLQLDHWPPFASRFIMELYRPVTGSPSIKNHLVKFIYNGEDVTRKLAFCRTRVGWATSGCSLQDLSNFFNNLLPNMGETTYRKACKVQKHGVT